MGPGIVWGHAGGDTGISTLIVFRPRDHRGALALVEETISVVRSCAKTEEGDQHRPEFIR